jgi:hypothetical protein
MAEPVIAVAMSGEKEAESPYLRMRQPIASNQRVAVVMSGDDVI